jgi:hypothetical protein
MRSRLTALREQLEIWMSSSGRRRTTPTEPFVRSSDSVRRSRLTATAGDFATPGTVYQIGLPPFRIDILTEISGATCDEATHDAVTAHLGAQLVRYIGLEAMIRNKRSAGRTKDLADVEALEEIRARAAAKPRS